jgi:hypothetical protein
VVRTAEGARARFTVPASELRSDPDDEPLFSSRRRWGDQSGGAARRPYERCSRAERYFVQSILRTYNIQYTRRAPYYARIT